MQANTLETQATSSRPHSRASVIDPSGALSPASNRRMDEEAQYGWVFCRGILIGSFTLYYYLSAAGRRDDEVFAEEKGQIVGRKEHDDVASSSVPPQRRDSINIRKHTS